MKSELLTMGHLPDRSAFIGGSDAQIFMDPNETALFHLWREKRCEIEPADFSGELIVQLGLVTDELKRCPTRHAYSHLELMYGVRHEP